MRSNTDNGVEVIPGSRIGLQLDSILSVPFPAAFFFRMQHWRALDGLSVAYRYGADRDLLMRCRLAGLNHAQLISPVYAYRRHDGSDTLVEKDHVVEAFLSDHWKMAAQWLKHAGVDARGCRAEFLRGEASRVPSF